MSNSKTKEDVCIWKCIPTGVFCHGGIVLLWGIYTLQNDRVNVSVGMRFWYDLLVNFVINPKLVFSREQLLDKFWGLESDVELRTVDVHIRRLRKAINIEHCKEIIRTVRSTGYALDWQ